MPSISTIPGIGKSSLELLEAAGFLDVEALANAGVDDLAKELERANGVLQIAKRTPSRRNVERWIVSAREMAGGAEPEDEGDESDADGFPEDARAVAAGAAPAPAVAAAPGSPVNYEGSREVSTLLAKAPFAIPLPAQSLMENQVAVADIPPALLLNRYSGDLEVKADDPAPQPQANRPVATNFYQKLAPSASAGQTGAAASSPENDRVALLRAPLEKTNRGKNPKSRWYIRGVLHSHPFSMTVGAFVTLLLMMVLPVAIVSAALLLLSDLMPARFDWVPKWILAFPLALPILGIAYAIWGTTSSCRICGQKLFVPRACLKNTKAHHIKGLGHIVPVCLHILLFRWFRCTFCGTAVRLKK